MFHAAEGLPAGDVRLRATGAKIWEPGGAGQPRVVVLILPLKKNLLMGFWNLPI